MDFRLGVGPLAAVERLQGELDEELVGGSAALVGGLFDALPLLGGDADVFLDGLNRGLSSRVWPVERQEWVANGGGIAVDPTLPDW